ncbi:MAG: hypothetical protein HUU20_11485 [Pirellulales bacterium]|nr:hypothetical protein [Pirellulales bacterium]
MAEPFDPYHVWLGIPPGEQPPNHYRLLGIRLFEDNLETIEHAADQRMMLLRTFQSVKHAPLAEKLLNEVSAARISLLNPEKKSAYDHRLRNALQPQKDGLAGSGADATADSAESQELGSRPTEKPGDGGPAPVFEALRTKSTRFLRPVRGKSGDASPPKTAARSRSRLKLAAMAGCAAIALVALSVVVRLVSRSGSRSTDEATALVFDWPENERAGAALRIDGRELAVPPAGALRVVCSPGEHRVSLRRPEFLPFEETIVVETGREARLKPAWIPQSYLVLQWPPRQQRDARMELDGSPADLSALPRGDHPGDIRVPIAPGSHRLVITRPGLEPFEDQWVVQPGQNITVRPRWKAPGQGTAAGPSLPASKMSEQEMPPAQPTAAPEPVATAAAEPQPPLQRAEPPAVPPGPAPRTEPDPALKRQQELEAKYAEGMASVEKLIAAWDFRGAWAALEAVRFEEAELAARLAQRREEVRLMGRLKVRMIEKINAADPPLKKSDLMLRGANGPVTKADDEGITSTLASGKAELHAWAGLNEKALPKLLQLVVDRRSAEDSLAAVVLALACQDAALAENYAEQAGNVDADLSPLAAAAWARAQQLLEKRKFPEAEAALAGLEKKYAATPWFAANRAAIDAARRRIQAGAEETEAENLYAQAVELFKQKELFDVKSLVDKLKAEHAASPVVTDGNRKPSLEDLSKAVADLGKRFIVRLDGQGDFTSIRAAVDAAPPQSMVEIQDNGPYNEAFTIPDSKTGLRLRGRKGSWPVITSLGQEKDIETLVLVQAPEVVMERLVLIHGTASAGPAASCLLIVAPDCRIYSSLLYSLAGPSIAIGTASEPYADRRNLSKGKGSSVEACLVLGGKNVVANGVLRECLFRDSQLVAWNTEITRCTCDAGVRLMQHECYVLNTIIARLEVERGPNNRSRLQASAFGAADTALETQDGLRRGCFIANPRFHDSANLDYRLMPGSPCIGKASGGGDIGCPYTQEMLELCKVALELRRRAVLKF